MASQQPSRLVSLYDSMVDPKVPALLQKPVTAGLINDRDGVCPFCSKPMITVSLMIQSSVTPCHYCPDDAYVAPTRNEETVA